MFDCFLFITREQSNLFDCLKFYTTLFSVPSASTDKMNRQKVLNNLDRAIGIKNVSSVHEILQKNPSLLSHLDCKEKVSQLLGMAIYFQLEEIVKLFIEFGVDVNFKNPLQQALRGESLKCLEILLENGAKLDGPSWNGTSPVEYIFDYEYPPDLRKEKLQMLIKYGLDTNFRTKKGSNLLHVFTSCALEHECDVVDVAGILLDVGVPLDEPDDDGFTPLHYAIVNDERVGNIELISFLIEKGADVNKKWRKPVLMREEFPLIWAVQYNHVELVELLLKNGAYINARTFIGTTSLHHACYDNYEKIISLLILNGADITAEEMEKLTPFSYLNPTLDNYYQCSVIIVRELAKLIHENFLVSEKDMTLIQNNARVLKYLEQCKNELSRMENTIFYSPFSYYSVLKMSKRISKLAQLLKNEEFLNGFEANLNLFQCYGDELQRILTKAIKFRDEKVIVSSRLNYIFSDFFPEVVVRKLTENFTVNDLPLE